MIVTSKGMLKIQGLSAMLGEPVFYHLNPRVKLSHQTHVAGWGRKASFEDAKAFAARHHLQLVCLEDGFIRSLGLGKSGAQALSIVKDTTGIYFDSSKVSDLESLIYQSENPQNNEKAKQVIHTIKTHGITKYNQNFVALDAHQFAAQKNILLIDQTFGDQSIKYAGASAHTFKLMLKQALDDHPDATIWIKTHPDVVAGKAKGHYDFDDFAMPRVKIIAEPYNPYELLNYIAEVYVVSSHLGFEALMNGNRVKCFGVAWYTGWGLTLDDHAPMDLVQGRRSKNKSLNHLFHCAYMQYASYVSPITGEKCEIETILELLITNQYFQKRLAGYKSAYGFSGWKKKFIRDFLNFQRSEIDFYRFTLPNRQPPVIAWGKKAKLLVAKDYKNVWTVEDGFIRSHGLGANLVRPYSLVFDDVGIYYDATKPSRLENILNQIELDTEQQRRAQKILDKLIQLNITKYNVGDAKNLQRPNAKQVLLVTGQVEDDLSVQLGGLRIKTNLDLLKAVRQKNPDAYIIYKPHPDVHAGLRVGQISESTILEYANQIELTASIVECFEISDELHTISSLSGFEALLRGVNVYCYGMPFYAGWGLTIDVEKCNRRNKQLNLNELIYGVLVRYALYNLPETERFGIPLVNVEDVIDAVFKEREMGVSSPILKSTFAKLRAKLVYGRKK